MSDLSAGSKRVLEFLNGKTFFAATVDGDRPRVRPFGFVAPFEGKLYFGNNTEKPSYAQLQANPRIEISAVSEDGSEWVRISGTVVFDIRDETVAMAYEALPPLKDMYGAPGSPQFSPFYLKDAEAAFCSFTAEPETVKL
jgi:uncharacterized pyridoxamine 5'-phosphate oxidase family protein